MASAGFQFAGGFRAGNTASGVLAANADTNKESPSNEHVEHADRITVPVGAGSKGCEEEKDTSGGEQRVGA